jgi:NAD(P)H-flavin reductase
MKPSGQVRLVFSDGETLHFPPIGGETILASAERAGHTLASNCREGTCRTCMARDDNEGEVLLCITPAAADISLNLPYRRTDLVSPSLRRAKINSFSRVSRSVWEVRYRLQFPLPFLPGQYVEATFPGIDGTRRFSMANAPSQTEQVLHVRDLPGGAMSDYLGNRAKPEDPFTVRGPYGTFYLRSTAKPKLFVSGGTGLAPIVSMLSSMDPGSAPPLSAVIGFAHADDSYSLDELRALSRKLPLEVVLAADSVGNGQWPGVIANPLAALREVGSVSLGYGTEAYLCGPPGMVAAARKELLARGFDTADVLNEEFVHSV